MSDNMNILYTIYNKLKALGVLDITEYRKYTSKGFMDLSIDILENSEEKMRIAMAHNFIQNGDVMADPDMEIMIYKKLQVAEALTFQQDSFGIYQEVYPEPGKVNVALKRQLNAFLNQWLTNLKNQGFYGGEN